MRPMHAVFDWPAFLPEFAAEAEAAGFSRSVLARLDDGPLTAWRLHEGKGPHIYLSSGIHGDEPAGPLALLELLKRGFFTGAAGWTLCPALNPGGLAAGTRENRHGIDLNRDYWMRSTPEVSAHGSWLESLPVPDLFISLHEDWESGGFYFYEINLGGDRPERARAIIDAARPWFSPEPGPEIDGHEARESGWIYHEAEADVPEGWPEAIFLAKIGCPLSFTFETPSRKPLPHRVAALAAAVEAACLPYLTAGSLH